MSGTTDAKVLAGPVAGGSPEVEVANDLVRRGLLVTPIAMLVGLLAAGTGGALSVAFAAALVLVNFRVSAALLDRAARISLGLVMGVALFGFLVRLALVSAAVWLVRDQWWAHAEVLAVTLIVSHLGLLAWEARHVSASLAFPGLQPGRPAPVQEQSA